MNEILRVKISLLHVVVHFSQIKLRLFFHRWTSDLKKLKILSLISFETQQIDELFLVFDRICVNYSIQDLKDFQWFDP